MKRKMTEIVVILALAGLLEFVGPDRVVGLLRQVPILGVAVLVAGPVVRFLSTWVDL